ncbi:hypothetical protein GCM10012287_18950 [Streptomyces daqingensis]|uniref:Extracellular small neutral protease n=1 Tax=Streptomyces daqingensis TaxID=1472640 RepID=A0ABQ2M5N0_9ACTN|nr:snapalysin family zinc-dependent metalloprotease [Streptomyces daqingensis]GGO47102.1 hypothetical protein GCM10012287_18950 [Streptomyces daqingensis]
MRSGPRKWATACLPLSMLALAACGSGEPQSSPPPEVGSATSIDGELGDSAGTRSGEDPSGVSRDGTDTRRDGDIGESAGAAASGGQAGQGEEAAAVWPVDDVVGAVPRSAPAGQGKGAVSVVTYDARPAGEYADAVRDAAASWNDRVRNVRLRPASDGAKADIRVTVVKGWPGADPAGANLGRGTVEIGREALEQGYAPARIVAHELGHLLGLEDKQPGSCSNVMSGKSPGTRCTNSAPSGAEVRQVEANFGADG